MEYILEGICNQNGRETNMDSLLLTERKISGTRSVLAVVCDGVGSLSDGAYASVESIRMLNEWFAMLDGTERAGLVLRDEISSINTRIIAAAKGNGMNTATTLSALLLVGRQYYIVHAGDSRIYSIDGSGLTQLTIDTVNESGALTSGIGHFDNAELYYSEGMVQSDMFLLCSDGLYKRIDDAWIFENIHAGNRKALRKTLSALSDQAIAQGERDNISIAIVKLLK